jgi:hypothetical protein
MYWDEQSCADSTGTYLGQGVACEPDNPCPQIGCCCLVPTGTCALLLEPQCLAAGGVWAGPGTSCPPCPFPGACLLPDGSCMYVFEAECNALGGSYQGCLIPCPQLWGACCFQDESCEVMEQPMCESSTGTWLGSGTLCSPDPCFGACCLPQPGLCQVLKPGECSLQAGMFQGFGTTCIPNPCPGACCSPGGVCVMVSERVCTELRHGCWWGANTTCDPYPCPICEIVPPALDFGDVPVGGERVLSFRIRNLTPGDAELTGTISEACEGFNILSGEGPFYLLPFRYQHDSLEVTVRFAPMATGPYDCHIETDTRCPRDASQTWCTPVTCHGLGTPAMLTGACCNIVTGECHVTTEPECVAGLMNRYMGDFTTCVPSPCPASAVGESVPGLGTVLLGAAPNPFTGSTTISYHMERPALVRLEIFDPAGRLVRTLLATEVRAGAGAAVWDGRADNGSRMIPGIYFYRFSHPGGVDARTLVLME